MSVNRDSRRGQPTRPATSGTTDPEVDIFEVGEERRVEAPDLEERAPIERRGASARRQGVEHTSVQHLQRLAVQVVETVERPVDDDACRVDPVLFAASNENR